MPWMGALECGSSREDEAGRNAPGGGSRVVTHPCIGGQTLGN